MDGVPKILDELLKQQARMNKLLDRCRKEGVDTKPLSLSFARHEWALHAKHDEIADIKSAHDSEENIDSQKPVRKNPGLYNPFGLPPQSVGIVCYFAILTTQHDFPKPCQP